MSHLPRSGFTRSFFTSCKSFMPKKKPKYLYPELHQAKAQKNFDRTEHKEIVDAQKLRHHWGKFYSYNCLFVTWLVMLKYKLIYG